MVTFPNAKINLGLNILNKRIDGFHNIETVFYPVQLCDILEIIEKPKGCDLPYFTNSGLSVDAPSDHNLCVKAFDLLKIDFNLPPIAMHLHKIIPFGAGLGGGSADAAYTITLLNKLFSLNLKKSVLLNYAKKLGSDCAFFIENKPALGTGKGEILESVSLNLSGYYIYFVKPDIHISTAEAYSGITPKIPEKRITEIIQLPIEAWKDILINDFESHLFEKHKLLSNIKESLYQSGAVYAAMSGSGSTIFGIFKNEPIENTNFKDYFTWIGKLVVSC
jgi:4-diphosphocytidyl-2-C-methyl-D-erythritol kinase